MATIKYKPKSPTFSVYTFKGKRHYHGCIHCKNRYCCSCYSPELDDVCTDCRQDRSTFIQMGERPRECCVNRRLATKDDRSTYLLAGPGPWWMCRVCSRQFTTKE